MLYKNLKNVWLKTTDLFLGARCQSGLPHRWPISNIISGNVYCQHPDCVENRRRLKVGIEEFELEGILIEGPKEKIQRIRTNAGKLVELQKRFDDLEKNNEMVLKQGQEQGMKMERKKLFDTLIKSRQLLLDQLQPKGVNEFNVRQFVEWYENQRDARLNPTHDQNTYQIGKNIIALEETLNLVMLESTQLT
jgi:hypothetical protein